MPLPTLAEFKRHLRIRHDADDLDLQAKLDQAIEHAEQFLNRTLPWLDEDGLVVPVPASVKAAIMIIGAELYANREQSVVGTIYSHISTAENLLHFHRKGLGV